MTITVLFPVSSASWLVPPDGSALPPEDDADSLPDILPVTLPELPTRPEEAVEDRREDEADGTRPMVPVVPVELPEDDCEDATSFGCHVAVITYSVTDFPSSEVTFTI